MKRLASFLLTLVMLLSLATPASAAAVKTSGAATTLRLESVTGTVQMKNGGGKSVKAASNTRLYNGYKLSTKKASYAHVSLDDAKVIKLDASSGAEVFQSGKKLELKVTSGQMFFNVSEPLKGSESLTIRTSTMVTGVRGTSGWVKVIDRNTTRISLLEGKLTITSVDPVTGKQRVTTIVAGQTATIVYHGQDKKPDGTVVENETIRDLIEDDVIHDEHIILNGNGLTVENLQEEDVPGFVAKEVKDDKELQKKIEENSPLSVPEIIGDADARLESAEKAAEEEEKTILEKLKDLVADTVEPLFKDDAAAGGGGGGEGAEVPTAPMYTLTVNWVDENGNPLADSLVQTLGENASYTAEEKTFAGYGLMRTTGDDVSGTMTGNKTVTFVYGTATTLNDPTTQDLIDALNSDFSVINITNANSSAPDRLDLGAAITGSNANSITADQVVNIQSGTVANNNTDDFPVMVEGQLNIEGTTMMSNAGKLTINGTVNVSDTVEFTNEGAIEVNSTQSLHINDEALLNNKGSIVVGGSAPGAVTVTGDLNNYNGTITVNTGSTLNVKADGDLSNQPSSLISVAGTLITDKGSTAENDGVFFNFGSISVAAPTGGAELILNGRTENYGSINARNSDEATGGTVSNSGTFTNYGDYNEGFINVETAVQNTGSFINASEDFSPANCLLLADDGTYTETEDLREEAYVMVQDNTGLITAWGQTTATTSVEYSPFYTTTQAEAWLSEHTYTLYGPLTGATAELPAIFATSTAPISNVELDLNGRTVELVTPLQMGTQESGDVCQLKIVDSSNVGTGGTGKLVTGSAQTLITIAGGSLVVDGVALSNGEDEGGGDAVNMISLEPNENGNAETFPIDVQITDSVLTSSGNAIYVSGSNSTLNVSGGTITSRGASGIYSYSGATTASDVDIAAVTGITVNGGILKVTGCDIDADEVGIKDETEYDIAEINVSNTTIDVTGNGQSGTDLYGIYSANDGTSTFEEESPTGDPQEYTIGTSITVTGCTITVAEAETSEAYAPDSYGIYNAYEGVPAVIKVKVNGSDSYDSYDPNDPEVLEGGMRREFASVSGITAGNAAICFEHYAS